MDDSIIVKFIKRRNEKGLELLIDNYGGLITSIVRKHLSNMQSYEEECIDDILLSIWYKINNFNKEKSSFKNWVAIVSKFAAIDYRRKYHKLSLETDITEEIIKASNNVEEEILRIELKEEVLNLLTGLSPKNKDLFIKHYFQGESIDGISKELNLKSAIIYNRLSRGRKKLKEITKFF
jgi:RNA polymerase sigma-70 factor (ECF subfamily)